MIYVGKSWKETAKEKSNSLFSDALPRYEQNVAAHSEHVPPSRNSAYFGGQIVAIDKNNSGMEREIWKGQ